MQKNARRRAERSSFRPTPGIFAVWGLYFLCAVSFSMAEPLFEGLIAIVGQLGQVSPASQAPDVGQGHSVKGIVLADSSKFGRASLVKVCPISEVSCIITDSELSADMKKAFSQHAVNLVVV